MANTRTKNRTYDALLTLHTNTAAITATAYGTDSTPTAITRNLGATAAMGSDQSEGPDAQFAVLVDVTSSDDTSADETYVFNVMGSDDSFSTEHILGTVTIPRGTATERYEVPCSLWHGDTKKVLKSVRCQMVCGGTTPSIVYHARIGKLQGSEK